MTDCPNAEIRDLLPDLLHDRLDAPTRARVLAHVGGCADCRAELELLRSLRGSMERAAPRVDVDRIVAALPKPGAASVVVQRRRLRIDWRIAAAVTFIAAGGTSVIVLRNAHDGQAGPRDTVAVVAQSKTNDTAGADSAISVAAATPSAHRSRDTVAPAPTRVARVTAPAEPSPVEGAQVASADEQSPALGSARIGNLNERQLKSLLDQIDHMEATPITEPEPVVLRVDTRATSPTGL